MTYSNAVVGTTHTLKVLEVGSSVIYVDAAVLFRDAVQTYSTPDHFLIDRREVVASSVQEGDELSVFVFVNGEGELAATAKKPLVQRNQCAQLMVKRVTEFGAFLDWGLSKDLFLPFAEQAYPVKEGMLCVVYAYLDERTQRMACSTKLHNFLPETNSWLKPKQPVELLIYGKSSLGYKAVIDGQTLGLIYHEELSQPLKFGTQIRGWVKSIREDGKIDLSIHTLDQDSRNALEQTILARLDAAGGRLDLSDKSAPELIFREFGVSKKNFKRALGALYKRHDIVIHSDHIKKVDNESPDS